MKASRPFKKKSNPCLPELRLSGDVGSFSAKLDRGVITKRRFLSLEQGFGSDLRIDHDIYRDDQIWNLEWPGWRVGFDVPSKSSRLSI